MDNNSLNQPNQPMGQPMQPTQPMSGPQPVGQPPMPNQPMPPMGQQPYGQSYPPYQQPPMPRPPKQPMDPAKKKKIILWSSIGGAAIALGIAAAIIIPILLRVDYGPAYATAKELKPKILDIYHSYDCEYVVDDVDSSYIDPKTYAEYIEDCKKVYNTSTDDLVAKLGNTDGVKRNDEIKNQFAKFNAEYTAASSGTSADLSSKLDLWQARHNFVYAADDLNYSSSADSEFAAAAKYLTESGNDALKTYGEGWLEKNLAIAAAYRAYDAASWQESSKYYNDYTNKKKEYNDWVAANRPDINTIAPLNFNDTSKMYSEFSTLYDLISQTYALNYNSGSGDCTEFLGQVYCD